MQTDAALLRRAIQGAVEAFCRLLRLPASSIFCPPTSYEYQGAGACYQPQCGSRLQLCRRPWLRNGRWHGLMSNSWAASDMHRHHAPVSDETTFQRPLLLVVGFLDRRHDQQGCLSMSIVRLGWHPQLSPPGPPENPTFPAAAAGGYNCPTRALIYSDHPGSYSVLRCASFQTIDRYVTIVFAMRNLALGFGQPWWPFLGRGQIGGANTALYKAIPYYSVCGVHGALHGKYATHWPHMTRQCMAMGRLQEPWNNHQVPRSKAIRQVPFYRSLTVFMLLPTMQRAQLPLRISQRLSDCTAQQRSTAAGICSGGLL